MKTAKEIITELKNRKQRAQENMKESISAGYSSPGFNQDLGYYDALGEFLEWIEEEETVK